MATSAAAASNANGSAASGAAAAAANGHNNHAPNCAQQQQNNNNNNGNPHHSSSNVIVERLENDIQRMRRTTKLLISVGVIFCVCWLPLNIVNTVMDITERDRIDEQVDIRLIPKYIFS